MSPRADAGFAPLPDGGRLAYSRLGQQHAGLPVLLNRPLGGSMSLWGYFAGELSRLHPVVMFDPRGVGRSSDVPLLHSTRAMAADALALLDYLQIERAHVFGLSLGGMVASWLAMDAPARTGSLILASTLPGPEAVSWRTVRRLLTFSNCLSKGQVAFEVCLVHQVLSPAFIAAHPERVRAIERDVRAMPSTRRNLFLLMSMALRHSTEQRLFRISSPTLLLFGGNDELAGRAARVDLATHLPNAVLAVMPNAGHDLSLEQPMELAGRVSGFLDSRISIGL
ncbi:MAG: alpha/beta hydrolase [Fluviicoccus sp.]|uniref:alpha/beta fold hydrolase n=1 Tax=Fluviicoccus sp. TaxID=2003552 RepID=UPI00271D4616|nr:alpha/beta hydrolase [Fluviicoccus sp.]MDO8331377.1 alpha/beta hydrolase [Fluviicoccus sp.]